MGRARLLLPMAEVFDQRAATLRLVDPAHIEEKRSSEVISRAKLLRRDIPWSLDANPHYRPRQLIAREAAPEEITFRFRIKDKPRRRRKKSIPHGEVNGPLIVSQRLKPGFTADKREPEVG